MVHALVKSALNGISRRYMRQGNSPSDVFGAFTASIGPCKSADSNATSRMSQISSPMSLCENIPKKEREIAHDALFARFAGLKFHEKIRGLALVYAVKVDCWYDLQCHMLLIRLCDRIVLQHT
jgi:hypothetical protein